jgi:hypothetical protein
MQDIIVNYALAHKDYFYGIATGYALSHIPQAVHYAFHFAMKWPWLRSLVLRDPAQSKAVIDEVAKDLEKEIDEESGAKAP